MTKDFKSLIVIVCQDLSDKNVPILLTLNFPNFFLIYHSGVIMNGNISLQKLQINMIHHISIAKLLVQEMKCFSYMCSSFALIGKNFLQISIDNKD